MKRTIHGLGQESIPSGVKSTASGTYTPISYVMVRLLYEFPYLRLGPGVKAGGASGCIPESHIAIPTNVTSA